MRTFIIGGVAVMGLMLGAAPAPAADATVVIPLPDHPFVAGEKDIIRIVPGGAPGLNVHHKLTGPAKLVTFAVRDLTAHELAAGLTRTEYALVPTGKGKVTFEVTTAAPTMKGGVKVTKYEFEVK